MVGIPRSKGCRLCVQRRVKCDLTRPICKNCTKGNRPCPGYDSDLRIHDEGSKLRKRFGQHDESLFKIDSDAASPITSTSSNTRSTDSPPDEVLDVVSQNTTSEWQPYMASDADWSMASSSSILSLFQDEFSPDAALPRPIVPIMTEDALLAGRSIDFDKSLALTVDHGLLSPYSIQEQLLNTFCSDISRPGTLVLPPAMQNHSRWLSQLPDYFGTKLLDSAVKAVTMIYMARKANSEQFVQESRQYYGRALRQLNSSLADQGRGMATETLSATVLLSFYEMFASESNSAWVRHAGGAGLLMRLRGPARHRTGLDRDVYLAYRHTIIIDAFQRDEECFLGEPEWLEMAKNVYEDLRRQGVSAERLEIFDLAEAFYMEYTGIPRTLRDARHLPISSTRMTTSEYIKHMEEILERTRRHRYQIKSIHVRFRDALRRTGLEPSSQPTEDRVFPQQYNYHNVFIASTNTGYWTILILLNMILKETEHHFIPENTGLYTMENRDIAQEICRATPFMLKSSFLGPFFITFALRLCLLIFDPGHERTWVINKLYEIGTTRMRMAADIPGFDTGTSMQKVAQTSTFETKLMEEQHYKANYFKPSS